jgi:hypothetical protein
LLATSSSTTSKLLAEALFLTAQEALRLVAGGTSSWRLGAQILEVS